MALFKALAVARSVCRPETLPERARDYARDTMTLGWEERLRARGRRRTDNDFEFGTALPRGTVLRDGDCLLVDEVKVVVSVLELEEAVFVVEPLTAADWALFAYAIGNSHQPLMVTESAIVCPEVLGMQQVLDYHRIPYRRDERTFTPAGLGGDVYMPGHQHNPAGGPGDLRDRDDH